MNREFLEKQGLSADQVEAVMAEYGKSVSDLKEDVTTATKEKEAVETAKTALEKQVTDLTEAAKNAEGLSEEEVNAKIKGIETQHKKEIKTLKVERDVKAQLKNVKYPDLIMKQLDLEKVDYNDSGELTGLTAQLEGLQKDYSDLFEDAATLKGGDEGRKAGEKPATALTKAEILEMPAGEKRQQAMADNPDLFNL